MAATVFIAAMSIQVTAFSSSNPGKTDSDQLHSSTTTD